MAESCSGKTKRGNSCKNRGKYCAPNETNKYCHIHVPKLDSDCAICLSKLYDPCYLNCNHSFHTKCVNKWLAYSNTCPVCRQPVYPETSFLLDPEFGESILTVAIEIAYYESIGNIEYILGNTDVDQLYSNI
jgi:hypothetical protein